MKPKTTRGRPPSAHTAPASPEVDDIEKSLESLVEADAEAQQAVKCIGGGKLIATVLDADGNVTGLVQSPRPRSGRTPNRAAA